MNNGPLRSIVDQDDERSARAQIAGDPSSFAVLGVQRCRTSDECVTACTAQGMNGLWAERPRRSFTR
jgi:hypothetical protein